MQDAIATAAGTRVSALVNDAGTALVPGIVLGLVPGEHHQRLQVLVRLSSAGFCTEEYLVPQTVSTGYIRHDYVGVPGDELRQVWTDRAMWDLLEIEAGLRGPQAGDAVRLTTAWHQADAGDVGVLDGYVGQALTDDAGSVTFNASTIRTPASDGRILVRASGGPASIATPLRELTKTGQTVQLQVWRWQRGGPGRKRRQNYTVTVPVWDWTPGTPS